jgi:hypothetical protein
VRLSDRGTGIPLVVPVLPVGWGLVSCWTADSVLDWVGDLVFTLAIYSFLVGVGAFAARPRWARHPLVVVVAGAVVSVVRVPGLSHAGGVGTLLLGVVVLAVVGAVLIGARRHRWPDATAEPLAVFPLSGVWYVVQGGGRLLNHHVVVAEQRAAVDLVRVGPAGSYRGDPRRLESYLAYGEPVVAPCAGRVVVAVDGIEDQAPGSIRSAPPYGNRVTIDNGSELITVAHLRPGTVTVAVGDVVEAGRPLGAVGNSGNSSAPHLHLQAERAGVGLQLRFAGVKGNLCRGRKIGRPVHAAY